MARKATSLKLAILNGNASHMAKKTLETREKVDKKLFDGLSSDNIEPPDFLTTRAKKIFRGLRDSMEPTHVLTDLDVPLLARFSQTYANYWEVNNYLTSEGYVVDIEVEPPSDDKPSGEHITAVNNKAKELHAIEKDLKSLSADLPFTPSSRASLTNALSTMAEVHKDEDEEFNPDIKEA